jgi:hypothetical protein
MSDVRKLLGGCYTRTGLVRYFEVHMGRQIILYFAFFINMLNHSEVLVVSVCVRVFIGVNVLVCCELHSYCVILKKNIIIIHTTGEWKFPECSRLPRVPNIGHSGKRGTRGRPPSPSATLGEERHPRTKNDVRK